jgi:CDP-glucose 4,6-dehydratase
MENVGMSPVTHKLRKIDSQFWDRKRVFLTGHTGFKGGWLSIWLASMGAKVVGYSLAPKTIPSYFNVVGVESVLEQSYIEDIRDLPALSLAINMAMPDILIHMAAQPLVRYSYVNPVETFSTNVMGTVNLLEAARKVNSIKSILIITTDKCYENQEWIWGYRENEPLGGVDPYSASKACAELVTNAYRQSFFNGGIGLSNSALASARAGNVIGGGDWSMDRLIPDALTAFEVGKPLVIRNPMATRPWQHVLESLSGYLMLAQALYEDGESFSSAWNFGPGDSGNMTVEEVIQILSNELGGELMWKQDPEVQPHEAHSLKLDCSKAHLLLGWKPRWSIGESIEKIVQWHHALKLGKNMKSVSLEQINEYLG